MEIIKEFLIFDDSNEKYNLKGGASLLANRPAPPEAQKALLQASSGVGSVADSNTSSSNTTNTTNTTNTNNKDLENVQEVSLLSDFGNSIMESVSDTYKKLKNFILGYFIIPIMFGSFAPALPFFVVMAAMFAVLKYLLGFFRKL